MFFKSPSFKPLITALIAVAASLAFTASASAISVNITQPANNSFHAATPQLKFTTQGTQLLKSCYYDSWDNLEEFCTSPKTFPTLSDGVHEYTVVVTNQDETEVESDTVTFTIDKTVPLMNITGTPDSGVRNTTMINLAATVTDANPDKVECKVDSGDWYGCAGTPTGGSIFVNNVSEGQHLYQFRATDKAGNSTSGARLITVDRTAPTASINAAWGEATMDRTPEFSVSTSDANAVTRICRIKNVTANEACDGSTWSPVSLPDGDYVAELVATDAAGNTTNSQRSFHLDATAPSYTINGFAGNATESTTPTITFSASDPLAVSHRCAIDPVDDNWNLLVACDGGSFTPASPLALGRHKFFYEASDALGNFDFTIYEFDVVAPGTLPNDPANPNGPSGGSGGNSAGAGPVVSVKTKSGKVKRGKFVSTVTTSVKPKGATAKACTGTVSVKVGLGKRKPVVKRTALKLVKGACVGVAKLKLPKALKGKKAKLTVSYAGGSGIGAFEHGVNLRKL